MIFTIIIITNHNAIFEFIKSNGGVKKNQNALKLDQQANYVGIASKLVKSFFFS